MTSGSSVYRSISSKRAEIETKQHGFNQDVYNIEKQIEELSAKKDEAFMSLALIYLPALEAQKVSETLGGARAEVQRIFKEKQARRQELETTMKKVQEERESLEMKLGAVEENLKKKAEERDGLAKSMKSSLTENPEYRKLIAQADIAKAALDQGEKRLGELREERDEKLPAFTGRKTRTSERFMQLLEMNYSPETCKSWFVNNGAKAINYSEQKREYDLLVQRPRDVEEVVKVRKQEYAALVEKIAAIEKAKADAIGLTKVMQEGNALLKEKENTLNSVGTKDKLYADCSDERAKLDSTKDSYHRKALDTLKDYLGGQDISALRAKAIATPSKDDDNLVAKIDELNLDIDELKNKALKAKKDRDALDGTVRGLRDIERNFKSQDYDSEYSTFSGSFNVNELLVGYILGRYNSSHVNSTIHSNHSIHKPAPVYTPTHTPTHHSSSYSSWSSGSHTSHSIGFGGGGGGRSHSIGL